MGGGGNEKLILNLQYFNDLKNSLTQCLTEPPRYPCHDSSLLRLQYPYTRERREKRYRGRYGGTSFNSTSLKTPRDGIIDP